MGKTIQKRYLKGLSRKLLIRDIIIKETDQTPQTLKNISKKHKFDYRPIQLHVLERNAKRLERKKHLTHYTVIRPDKKERYYTRTNSKYHFRYSI